MSKDTKPCLKVLPIHFIEICGKRTGPDGGLHLNRENPDEEDSRRFIVTVGNSRPWRQIGLMEAKVVDGVEWRVIQFASNPTAKIWYDLLVRTPDAQVILAWAAKGDEPIAQPTSPRGMIC